MKLACWDYDRTRPLIDKRVQAGGLALDISVMRPREAFTRMLEREEFDAAEVSLASYACLKAEGDTRFVGIPVALSRMFRHSCIYVRSDAGIIAPADLRGRRIGAAQLDSTGMIFIKGMLHHDYGVRSADVQWILGGLEKPARPAAPVAGHGSVEFFPNDTTLNDALREGMIDAILSNHIPSSFLRGEPHVSRLFPDFKAVEQDYYARTGIFPIMHTVVIRSDVYQQDPSVAARLYRAFCDARDLAVSGLRDTDALRLSLPWLIDHVEEAQRIFGQDYWSYGASRNRLAWNALCDFQVEQKLSPRRPGLESLFVVDDEHMPTS